MSCFPCFSSRKACSKKEHVPVAQARDINPPHPSAIHNSKNIPAADANNKAEANTAEEEGSNTAKTFTFRELATATKNFRQECLLGEGGIGRVFKATLPSSGQIVAVRQLDRSKTQGSREFQVEVLMLSLLRHPNLVTLIGYCSDGDQRLLVYEYLPLGSLENHLFDMSEDKRPLDWLSRMKIASGVAQGLEHLHEKANPPIIYRDLKSSNILLDETNNPKLSEYGLAKLLQSGNKMSMSAYGYCAPEYERHGGLTSKSDVYSFGVVLLELITGRRAYDASRPANEQNLVSWAQPIFRDPKRFPDMADPLLRKQFSINSLNQVVGIASMCLQEEPSVRPLITDIVATLSFLATAPPDEPIPAPLVPILLSKPETSTRNINGGEANFTYDDSSDSSDNEDIKGNTYRDKESENLSSSPNRSSSTSSSTDFSPNFKGR
ncbi:hypothetical protein OROHE_025067 [Orobanche hederae]